MYMSSELNINKIKKMKQKADINRYNEKCYYTASEIISYMLPTVRLLHNIEISVN